jgi:hypothetical protein
MIESILPLHVLDPFGEWIHSAMDVHYKFTASKNRSNCEPPVTPKGIFRGTLRISLAIPLFPEEGTGERKRQDLQLYLHRFQYIKVRNQDSSEGTTNENQIKPNALHCIDLPQQSVSRRSEEPCWLVMP